MIVHVIIDMKCNLFLYNFVVVFTINTAVLNINNI